MNNFKKNNNNLLETMISTGTPIAPITPIKTNESLSEKIKHSYKKHKEKHNANIIK